MGDFWIAIKLSMLKLFGSKEVTKYKVTMKVFWEQLFGLILRNNAHWKTSFLGGPFLEFLFHVLKITFGFLTCRTSWYVIYLMELFEIKGLHQQFPYQLVFQGDLKRSTIPVDMLERALENVKTRLGSMYASPKKEGLNGHNFSKSIWQHLFIKFPF